MKIPQAIIKILLLAQAVGIASCFSTATFSLATQKPLFSTIDNHQEQEHVDHVIPSDLLPDVAQHRRDKLGISFLEDNDDEHVDHLIPTDLLPDVAQHRRDKLGISFEEEEEEEENDELYIPFQELVPGVSDYELQLQAQLLHARGLSPPLVALYSTTPTATSRKKNNNRNDEKDLLRP